MLPQNSLDVAVDMEQKLIYGVCEYIKKIKCGFVVSTLIDNDFRHQSAQNVVHLASPNIVFYNNIQPQRKCLFQSITNQDCNKKNEQALSKTFSQSDWFISQNEHF